MLYYLVQAAHALRYPLVLADHDTEEIGKLCTAAARQRRAPTRSSSAVP